MKKLLLLSVCCLFVSGCSADLTATVTVPKVFSDQKVSTFDPIRQLLPGADVSLNLNFNSSTNPLFTYTEQDFDNLLRTTLTEVGYQDPTEIRWMINVVINRLLSGQYGNSITDVVKACTSFKRVRIYNSYGKKKKGQKRKKFTHTRVSYSRVCQFSVWNPYDNSYRIVSTDRVYSHPNLHMVKGLIQEELENRQNGGKDITNGCNHYFHPQSMIPRGRTPSWAHGQEQYRIGAGVFVKI